MEYGFGEPTQPDCHSVIWATNLASLCCRGLGGGGTNKFGNVVTCSPFASGKCGVFGRWSAENMILVILIVVFYRYLEAWAWNHYKVSVNMICQVPFRQWVLGEVWGHPQRLDKHMTYPSLFFFSFPLLASPVLVTAFGRFRVRWSAGRASPHLTLALSSSYSTMQSFLENYWFRKVQVWVRWPIRRGKGSRPVGGTPLHFPSLKGLFFFIFGFGGFPFLFPAFVFLGKGFVLEGLGARWCPKGPHLT